MHTADTSLLARDSGRNQWLTVLPLMMMSFTVCWEPGVTHKTCFSNS